MHSAYLPPSSAPQTLISHQSSSYFLRPLCPSPFPPIPLSPPHLLSITPTSAILDSSRGHYKSTKTTNGRMPIQSQSNNNDGSNNINNNSDNSNRNSPPPLSLFDSLSISLENILVLCGNRPPRDCAPLAKGDITSMFNSSSPFFLTLHQTYENTGPIYKLAFGPKVFIVIQDPIIIRHILRDSNHLYDKGILAEILEDIMGKGLIPANHEIWKSRRKTIVPGFHKTWLSAMTHMFSECTQVVIHKLIEMSNDKKKNQFEREEQNTTMVEIDMENIYCSLALDIIGKAVFNYDFGSVTKESPVIQAVYRVLREAEHRSKAFLPYWKIPTLNWIIPRQRQFQKDMKLIRDILDMLIQSAKETRIDADINELEQRDYTKAQQDCSILRFLVDLHGEETADQQLRDDLITMLIAGHETTAAALTWTTFELAQRPDFIEKARKEIDAVLGEREYPNMEDVKKLSFLRRLLAEALRLYPQPPLLIRRLLADDVLPKGGSRSTTELRRGTDVFINVYSLHRSKDLWERPNEFDPDRWLKPFSNPGVEGWKGYTPAPGLDIGSPLYPNEQNADFAFLPFGGGARKCIGDQFAVLESIIALAMIIRRFDFQLVDDPSNMQMDTGATIHTRNGLRMRLRPKLPRRQQVTQSLEDQFAARSSPVSQITFSRAVDSLPSSHPEISKKPGH